MELSSRFASFVGKTVQSGAKPSRSMYPTLLATSTKDKFQVDKNARAILGIDEGSYIVLIDMNIGAVTSEDGNNRWFVTPGYKDDKGNFKGAKIGKGGTFSYAGVYAAMQLNVPTVTEASTKDLVENRKGRIYETKGEKEAFVAANKIQFRLEKYTTKDDEGNVVDLFEVAQGVKQPVFALVERTEIPHTSEDEVTDAQGADSDAE